MTKKHFLTITAAAAIVISMTGCQNSTASYSASAGTSAATASESAAATSAAESESQSAEASDSAQTQEALLEDEELADETGVSIPIYGAAGDLINASDITSITGVDEENPPTPDTLTEDNWYIVDCDRFAYLAVPSGYCVNSIDNADIFNAEDRTFADMPQNADITYVKVRNGEEFMGFTVSDAATGFSSRNDIQADGKMNYFVGSLCSLSGSVTLTGYVNVASEEDDHTAKHDIGFVPDENSLLLPVANFDADSSVGCVTRLQCSGNDKFAYATEYPAFDIGNVDDEGYAKFDFSGLPDDGSYVKARITLSDIRITSSIEFYSGYKAVITYFEII